ncbi:flagellar filament capping protein FliD [Rhodoferax sp.]|uniref:flagellar filament capping protein FliD n=1 Tax=Rhodoferax sp. TaxID=50421 RepID=UPI00284ED696|nr:flagellar filament capping protein FliD [Rhodoferax sp.]MDR3368575.1 hypothetical protein [Rhodoferax sp.]
MSIGQVSSASTSSATTSSQTATQAAATAAANPLTAGINRATTKLQTQLATATANLSTLGKFKSSVTVAQASAKSLTTLTSSSTSDEVKKALTAFISDFNNMVAATKTAATDTSGVGTLSRGMTRAMTADFSKVDALRQMGFTKASDGTLKLDSAKFDAAFKAGSSSVQSTLSKLGQLVDKAATQELASGGRLSSVMSAFSSKSSTLQLQQSALAKAAQQYANFSSSSTSSVLSAYQ